MTIITHDSHLLPVLKVNNREKNLRFFVDQFGLRPLLEDGPFASLSDQGKREKLILEEVPGNRIRAVEGPKKLARLVLKAEKAEEIEALLAAGSQFDQLFKGKKAWAFEARSPQGDLVLLHAEDHLSDLHPYQGQAPQFEAIPDFSGLSACTIDLIEIHTPDPSAARDFYDAIGHFPQLAFIENEGPDLNAASDHTWDLSRIHVQTPQFDIAALEEKMAEQTLFVPKNKAFLLVADPSQIELWFEKI